MTTKSEVGKKSHKTKKHKGTWQERMQVCKCVSIQVFKYASIQAWKYTSMQCKYANKKVCKYVNMQVWKYHSSIKVYKYKVWKCGSMLCCYYAISKICINAVMKKQVFLYTV